MSTTPRCELLVFLATFLAFAYFNQGGGWNQNARFAEVRAIVEEGRFAIDNFLVYQRDPASDDLIRCPLKNAEYEWEGRRHRLCWVDMEWNFFPVGEHPLGDAEKTAMVERCSSGDIGYVPENGQFHPNKPPGTSLAAVPGYWIIYHIERALGLNPDSWRVLDVNLWLTSVLSVGLAAAVGSVIFFRLARDFAGGKLVPALGATLAFAFGTTFFPFATLLFDHALTAVLLLASFYLLRQERIADALGKARQWPLFAAGFCAGFAVLTNYVAIGAVAVLGLYALLSTTPGRGAGWLRRLRWRPAIFFAAGGIGPALVLLTYGYICYGSPFRPGTDFQNPLFRETHLFLGMFSLPHSREELWRVLYVAQVLIYSPFRGLFWFSPVLLLGVGGWWVWVRNRRLLPEALVCGGVFLFFFTVNMLFNGFHAGFSAGPRYLVPGIPFLALPLVVPLAHRTWRCVGIALGVLSIGINLLLTATDAQNPAGVGGHARAEGRHEEWLYDPVGEYALPLFFHERAWPLLRRQMEIQLDKAEARMDAENLDADARRAERETLRGELMDAIVRGESSPFLLGAIEGPVSVNPIGGFEGLLTFGFYPPRSEQVRWASFNLGELLWPRSRLSLLPLLLLGGGLCAWAWRLGRREDSASRDTLVT